MAEARRTADPPSDLAPGNQAGPVSEARRAIRDLRRPVAGSAVLGAGANLLLLTSPLYLALIFDKVLTSGSIETLVLLTAMAVMAVATFGALVYCRDRILTLAGYRIHRTLMPVAFKIASHRAAVAAGDSRKVFVALDQLRNMYDSKAIARLVDLVWSPIFFLILFGFHPYIGGLITVGGLSILALTYLQHRWSPDIDAKQREQKQRLIDDIITNQKAVVSRHNEPPDALRRQWSEHVGDDAEVRRRAALGKVRFAALGQTIRQLLQIMILGLGGYLAVTEGLSAGVVVAASILGARGLAPIEQCFANISTIRHGLAAARKLDRAASAMRPRRIALLSGDLDHGRIILNKIEVGNRFSNKDLGPLNLQINAGEVLAVTGESGAGKSLLLNLLAGLVDRYRGTIAHQSKACREFSTMILDDAPLIYTGTVADNIALFDRSRPDRVAAASKLAGLHDKIMQLPDGYETVLRSDQPQAFGLRWGLAMARCYYANPDVYLIDPPLGRLDHDTEDALGRLISGARAQGKFVVLATHAPQTVRSCDRMIVLRNGCVVADKHPKEMLALMDEAAKQAEQAQRQA